MSVSYTTRPIRPGEVDGKDYHFVSKDTFRQMVEDDQFLEWARVCEERYGTPRDTVFKDLEAGRDILFDIDWQGAQRILERGGIGVGRGGERDPAEQGSPEDEADHPHRQPRGEAAQYQPTHLRLPIWSAPG